MEAVFFCPAQRQPGKNDRGVFRDGLRSVCAIHDIPLARIVEIDVRTADGGGVSIPYDRRAEQTFDWFRSYDGPPLDVVGFACHGFGDDANTAKPEGGLQVCHGGRLGQLAAEIRPHVDPAKELLSPWWACSGGDAPLPGHKHGPAERFHKAMLALGVRVRVDAHADRPETPTDEGVGHAFFNPFVSRTEWDPMVGATREDWIVVPGDPRWPGWKRLLRKARLSKRYFAMTREEIDSYIEEYDDVA